MVGGTLQKLMISTGLLAFTDPPYPSFSFKRLADSFKNVNIKTFCEYYRPQDRDRINCPALDSKTGVNAEVKEKINELDKTLNGFDLPDYKRSVSDTTNNIEMEESERERRGRVTIGLRMKSGS